MATRRLRNRLSDEAAAYIREAIIAGELRQGEFLRPEKVAEDLSISVTPAREALLSLEGEGFVEMVPRRGFVIAPLSADDIRDIFVSQALICGELASRAALKMSEEDIAELETVQRQLEDASGKEDYEALSEHNRDFHRRINLAAGTRKMLWLLTMTLRYTPSSIYSSTAGWVEASCVDHADIIASLKSRNPEAARLAMHRHMTHLGELLADQIEERRASA